VSIILYNIQVNGPTFMLYKTLNEPLHPETLPTERHGSESNPEPEPHDDRHAGRERKPAVSSGWKTQSRHKPEEHGGQERKPKRPRTRYSLLSQQYYQLLHIKHI